MRSTIRCNTRWSVALIAAFWVSLVACDNESLVGQREEATGEMTVFISLGKALQSQIARAEVVVTASDMVEMRVELTVDGTSLRGTVTGIPAGANRLFTLNAYDSGGSLTYTGSEMANIIAGGPPAQVEVTLRSVSGPTGGPALAIRGSPLVTQGRTDFGWSSSGSGEAARIAGEIENTGTATAENVRLTVTLRDPNGNLLGRVRDHAVGTIQPGDSELFEVFIESVFSGFGVDTSSYQVEVDINSD